MNWIIKFKIHYLFFLIPLIILTLLFYKLSDEKLTPKALDLLIMDGHANQVLRQNVMGPDHISRLPKDSIFDHQKQVQLIESQFNEFKTKIQELKKNKSNKDLISQSLNEQLDFALVSLYSLNPMILMKLNLDIVIFCLTELNSLSIPVNPLVKTQLQKLDSDTLFLRASRFHAQSILGSIDVLRGSQLLDSLAVHLIQKQRLTNRLAEISLNPQFDLTQLSTKNSWLWPQNLELIYAHFFKQLIYDPKIDLNAQIFEIKSLIK